MGVEDATKTINDSTDKYGGKFIASVGLYSDVRSANAELIAAAPKLLAALEAVEAFHASTWRTNFKGGREMCRHDSFDWPCPTVRAITEALS